MRWCIAFAVLVACGARTDLGARATLDASSDAHANDCGASLASGPAWLTPFGPAQHVCLSSSSPPGCPNDAVVYGGGTGWAASLSSISDATWVWRPGISPSDLADNVEVTFTRTFVLSGAPTGTISIAADDFAEVTVNGKVAGTIGSTTNVNDAFAAQSSLTTFDLAPFLVAGSNTIAIVGRNGPASFSCGTKCTYAQNFAGVVFGGRLDCH